MQLIQADATLSQELADYLAQSVLPGTIDLHVQRPNGFFSPYRIHSTHYDTYLLRSAEDQIQGVASIIYRQARFEGGSTVVGYATDLRLTWSRESLLFWSQNFLPALEESRRRHGARIIYSVVSQAQSQTYNLIIRPRNIRRNFPRYFLIRHFDVVTVHGQLPWAPKPLSSIKIDPADERDAQDLCDYLERKNRDRPLSAFYTPEKFQAALERWPDMSLSNFLLARDPQGKIIGCVAPWDSSPVQQFIPAQYNGLSQTLYNGLRATAWSGLTRPLSAVGKALNFSFLTHFHADNPDIVDHLLFHSLRKVPRRHFLAYAHFADDLLFRPPKHYLTGRIPFALYAIVPPGDELPLSFRIQGAAEPPSIEPALL